jgi:signal transduction histidine kinase
MEDKVIGAVILFEDITPEKLLERNKEEFFAVASHELRTPLTAMRGNAALIRDFFGKTLNEKDMREMLDSIYDSSTRLLKLVDNILHISRLEQNKIVFEKNSFDLNELVKEVVKDLNELAREKSITLVVEEPTYTLPLAYSDKDRVKEILYNLIGNAMNFTKQGSITIRVASEKADYLKCFVTDTGSGILPLNQGLLFKKFQQAGENVMTRDVSKGTGLGLYISKLLVEGLGGEIKLEESVVDRGSTFSFTLPIK